MRNGLLDTWETNGFKKVDGGLEEPLVNVVVFRQNTEGLYAGVEWTNPPEAVRTALATHRLQNMRLEHVLTLMRHNKALYKALRVVLSEPNRWLFTCWTTRSFPSFGKAQHAIIVKHKLMTVVTQGH